MRNVLRCGKCSLVQFETVSGDCRKCGVALYGATPGPVVKLEAKTPMPGQRRAAMTGFGATILALRRAAGLTQLELATALATPRSYISRLELGKFPTPHMTTMERFAKYFELPVSIFGGQPGEAEIIYRFRLLATNDQRILLENLRCKVAA